MRVPSGEGRDRRIEGGRVAEAGVSVAGDGRGRDERGVATAGKRIRPGPAAELRAHHPSRVDLRADDVTVHVDAAGHHHEAAGIDDSGRRGIRFGGRGHDAAAGDPEVADLAVDPVSRVVDGPAGDLEQLHRHRVAPSSRIQTSPLPRESRSPW